MLTRIKKQLALVLVGLAVIHTSFTYADDVCAGASLINPLAIDGGIGGTGAPANGGIGGTGMPAEHGGIGGTGAPIASNRLLPDDGGVGGTGIVGVITGFASVCVNGIEVHYDSQTPVSFNGKPAKLSDLAVGHTVVMKVDHVGGQMRARAIGGFDVIAGPIDKFDASRQQLQIMGQNARIDKAILPDSSALASGSEVSISGHRLGSGEIIATRVDPIHSSGTVSTLGQVTGLHRDGFVVNGTKVNISDKTLLDQVKVGSDVRVTGIWSGNAVVATQLEHGPIRNALDRTERAVIEGIAQQENPKSMNVDGNVISLDQKMKLKGEGKLLRVEMHRGNDGGWVADKIEERHGSMYDKYRKDNKSENNSDKKDEKSNSSDTSVTDKSDTSRSSGSSGQSGSSGSSNRSGSSDRSGGSNRSGSSGSSDRSGSSGSNSSGSGSSGRSGSSGKGSSHGGR